MALEKTGLGVILEFLGVEEAVAKAGKLQSAVKGMHEGFTKVGSGVSQVGMALAPVILGVGGATAGAVQRFAAFEEVLAKIGTLLPGGMEQAKEYGDTITKMSLQFGRSAGDVGEGMFQAISAGISAGDAAVFMDTAMKAAITGFTSTATSVDGLTNVLNAYHLKATDAMKIADYMFMANQIGKTTFEELADAIGKVAPTAALVGVQFDELSSAIAAMTLVGIDTDMATVSINQALTAFLKPSREAEKAAKQYGIELTAASLRSKGFLKSITEINDKIGGNEELLATIFGNVRAFRAAATLAVGEGAKVFDSTLQQVRGSLGITEKNFVDVSKTIKFKFGQALQVADLGARQVGLAFAEVFGLNGLDPASFAAKLENIKGVATAFFTGMKSSFEEVAGVMRGFGMSLDAIGIKTKEMSDSGMAESAGKVMGLTMVFGALGIAIFPVTQLIGGLGTILSGLGSIASGAWGALGAVAEIMGVGIAPAAGVVLLVLAVVGAVIAAIVGNVQGAGTAFDGLVYILKLLGGIIGGMISTLWDGLVPVFNNIVNIVGAFLAPVFDSMGRIFGSLIPLFESAWTYLTQLMRVFVAIGAILQRVLVPILKWLGETIGGVLEPVFEGFAIVLGKVFDVLASIFGFIADVLEGLAEIIGAVPDADSAVRSIGEGVKVEPYQSQVPLGPSLPEGVGQATADLAGAKTEAAAAAAAAAVARTPITLNNNLSVDGKNLNVASSRAQLELTERSGASVTPWQRRAIIERGVALQPT